MPTMLLPGKRLWKKVLLLCAIGIVLSFIMNASGGKPNGLFFPDLFFTISTVFLFVGLWGFIRNLGTFNSLTYGFKSLMYMFRGKRLTPKDQMTGAYLEYIQSRPKDSDAPWLLGFTFAFLLLSVLASLSWV